MVRFTSLASCAGSAPSASAASTALSRSFGTSRSAWALSVTRLNSVSGACASTAAGASSRARSSACITISGLALALVPPQHIAAPAGAVERAPEHEQQVGEPVQVLSRALAHRFGAAEGHHAALGAPARGAREVRQRGGARAARQDEFLERGQFAVVRGEE